MQDSSPECCERTNYSSTSSQNYTVQNELQLYANMCTLLDTVLRIYPAYYRGC